jgi:hypothetical protein
MSKEIDALFSKTKDWKQFMPYVIHNTSMDQVSVYLKDSSFYCEPMNDYIDVYKNMETGEIVGVKIKDFSKVDKF